MKRDMDLVRKILLTIEEEPHGHAPSELMIDGYTEEQVGYHALLMIEGGLAVGEEDTTFGQSSPSAVIMRLTWKGHEFIEASRNPAMWDRAKALAAKAGNTSFTILTEALMKGALERLGG